jgi:hypothetical protein
MSTWCKYWWVVVLSLGLVSNIPAASKIAVTTKVKGKAELQRIKNPGFQPLKPGTVLEDGDKIRTGVSGFVALIFIDDKTTLKLKGETEVEITGKRTAAAISKKINMGEGTLRAQVSKQRKGDFIVQTPTSVASVKGTDFWLISDPFSGDQLFGLEGIINFTNIFSGVSIDVLAGVTGTSAPDGTIDMTETDPATIPTDPEETEEAGVSELRIELQAPDGTTKVLIIRYQ